MPPLRSHVHRDTEIDVYTGKNTTEVDIHRSTGGHHHSRERRSPRDHDGQLVVAGGRDREHDFLRVEERRTSGRRAHSAAPLHSPVDEEAEYISSRIDSRGRMGEAWNGATKNWTIVDVPPGTERVRMNGVGGGAAEVTWQRYNGIRRSKFLPERDVEAVTTSTTVSDTFPRDRDRLSIQVYDRDKEVDIERERVSDRRVATRPRPPDMWTEITKDLVCREAIQRLGYPYEETEWFFYVMDYLRYVSALSSARFLQTLV